MKLTNRIINRAKAKEREYSLSDGKGLYLRIKPNGLKVWLFNYVRPQSQKRTNITIGEYPYISIDDAREQLAKFKTLLAKDIDPQHKPQQITFKEIAINYLDDRKKRLRFNERTAKNTLRIIEIYLLPKFSELRIENITPLMIINHFKAIEKETNKTVTIKKAIQKMKDIYEYAKNRDLIAVNPVESVGKEFDNVTVKHRPTIEPEALGDFLKALKTSNTSDQGKHLIYWQLLTMTRPSETAMARYDDIDEAKRTWKIIVRKGGRDRTHIIPLTIDLLALLNEIKKHRKPGNPYLFTHSYKQGEHASPQTANAIIKRLGYGGQLTAHGLRSLASTYLNELGENPELVEINLSHLTGDKVRQAYNKAKHIPERRKLINKLALLVKGLDDDILPEPHLKLA